MIKLVKDASGNITVDYTIQEKLGEGAFAEVFKAQNKKTKESVAIKFIRKKEIFVDQEKQKLLFNEISVMKKLRHPNIIRLRDVYETKDHICLVMDLVTGGELLDKVISLGSYTERDASFVMLALFRTVKYIHDLGIAHRDLKPENVLYESKAPTAPIKISDFGFAIVCQTGELMEACLGTLAYVAPEVLHQTGYGLESDIWSLGCIMYVLLSGAFPFYDEDEHVLFELVRSGTYSFPSPNWDVVSVEAKDLIKNILVADPKRRFTVNQCLAHRWFKSSLPTYKLTAAQANLKENRGKRR